MTVSDLAGITLLILTVVAASVAEYARKKISHYDARLKSARLFFTSGAIS